MERKLAPFLRRLMQQDEADTFERLQRHRKSCFEPEIAKYLGRVSKLTDDEVLAEFGSVVEAVSCATVLQDEMAARNRPAGRTDVRIGVHVGDVIVERVGGGSQT
jgi:adenylate cyclase